jgi:arsenate reductase
VTRFDDRSRTAHVSVHVYQYPNCGTCKKALKWLDARRVAYTKSDLVTDRIPRAKLADLFRRSGLPIARMFNTSGESYRSGNFKERLGAMSEAEAIDALAADGKLVKRPILDAGTHVLVGFDEAAYARALV